MGLTLIGANGPRRGYITNLPPYLRQGVGNRFPFALAAARVLRAAKAAGYEEIVVESPGLRPRVYSVKMVEETCRRSLALRQFLPRKLTETERLLEKYQQLFINP